MIRIQLATSADPVSAFIRWYTWSAFSHVDFVLPDGRLLGARLNGGVQIREPGYAPFTRRLLLEYPDAPTSVLTHARRCIGAAYDWRAIAGLGLRRDWREPHRWFCSELVAWSFEQAGFPILRTQYVDRVTPRDVCISPLFRPATTGDSK